MIGDRFADVLHAARAGDQRAFAELYDAYNPLLLRYFASRARAAADDLAADTWLGAARTLSGFDGAEPQFRSWLFSIAHHRLADHGRARRRRGPEPAGDEAMGRLAAADDPEATVVDALAGQEAARRIAGALSADQAEVVLLRVLGGLDVDQVAAILGRRPGTVRVLQHRALRRLAKEFPPEV